jgi:ankyrin repeat protein
MRSPDATIEKFSSAEIHADQYDPNICRYYAATDNVDKLREAKLAWLLKPDHMGNSALHYAAESGSYRAAEYIISFDLPTSFPNDLDLTPAHLAARIGDLTMLTILSKSPAIITSVSLTGWNPLHCAIQNEHFHCVEFLVNRFSSLLNDVTNEYDFHSPALRYLSPLDLARFVGNDQIVSFLKSRNAPSSFLAAALSNKLPAISFFVLSPDSAFRKLLLTQEGPAALECASSVGNYKVCHFLLERGCRSESWQTLLRIAVLSKSVPTVTVIACRCAIEEIADACFFAADAGLADIVFALLDCLPDTELDSHVLNGDTLFLRFMKRNLLTVVEKVLAKHSVDVTRRDSRRASALHYAAALGAISLVRALHSAAALAENALVRTVKSTGPLNERDIFGRIPLHYAIFAGHTDTIRWLVLARSDVNIADNFGITPLVAALALGEKFILPSEIAGSLTYTMDFEGALANLQPSIERIQYFDYRTKTTKCFTWESPFLLKGEVLDVLRRSKMAQADLRGLRLMHVAIVMTPYHDRLEECFQKNARIQDDVDELGRPPIHVAAMLSRTEQMKLLMRKNAALGIIDGAGNSIFHYIRDDSLIDFVQPIFEACPTLLTTANNRGEYPIHVAAAAGAHRTLMK